MAKTPQAVRELLERVWVPARTKAKADRDAMQELIAAEGGNFKLAAWDWRFCFLMLLSTVVSFLILLLGAQGITSMSVRQYPKVDETGITIMKMDEGLDTGAMAMVDHVRIAPDMTAGELHDRLAPLGANLIVRTLAALERGSLVLMPQPEHGITYAAKISKDETRIDWSKPAPNVHNHIRGLSPFPGAWFEFGGVRVKALRSIRGDGSGAPGRVLDEQLTIACGEGAVRLLQVQRAGKHPMPAEEFLRGTPVKAGGTVA